MFDITFETKHVTDLTEAEKFRAKSMIGRFVPDAPQIPGYNYLSNLTNPVFTKNDNSWTTLAYNQEGDVVGFVAGSERNNFSTWTGGKVVQLTCLVIDPSYRGKGISSEMFRRQLEQWPRMSGISKPLVFMDLEASLRDTVGHAFLRLAINGYNLGGEAVEAVTGNHGEVLGYEENGILELSTTMGIPKSYRNWKVGFRKISTREITKTILQTGSDERITSRVLKGILEGASENDIKENNSDFVGRVGVTRIEMDRIHNLIRSQAALIGQRVDEKTINEVRLAVQAK